MSLPDKLKLVFWPPLENGKRSKKISNTTLSCKGSTKFNETAPCWNSMRSSGCTRITCDGSDSGSTTNSCSQGASTSSAGATSSHTAGHEASSQGTIQEDSCFRLAYEEPTPAGHGGQLAMDVGGALSLKFIGDVFVRVPTGWDADRKSEIFSLESKTYPQLFLAVDTTSPNYTVKGMTKQAMGNIKNSHWKYTTFDVFPSGSGYFALQYMGTHFVNPDSHPRYFVIENNATTFRIADRAVAEQHGALGYIPC